jgi:hypothetical protein
MTLDSEIKITVESETIRLRPTLRAAYRLERRYNGFDKLATAVADGNLTVMADIVTECSSYCSSIPDFLRVLDGMPLRGSVEYLSTPILKLIFAMAGLSDDPADQPKDADNGETIAFADYHEKLFGIGCGVLGWTPDTTWQATPAEILAAYHGRMDLLATIFGGKGPDGDGTPPREHTPEEIANGLAKLKAMSLSGQNRGIG